MGNGVSHGRSSHSDNCCLSAWALGDVGRSGNDSNGATNGQSLAADSDEPGGIDDLSVDNSGSRSSASVSASITSSIASTNGSTSVSAGSSTSVARRGTWSESSRKSDDRPRRDNSGAGGTGAVRKNSRSCDHGWNAADRDSLAASDSQRGRIDKLSDLGDSRKGGHIARRVRGSGRRHRVSSGVKIDSLGSRTCLSDNLGDCSGRARVASFGTRSCSDHSSQAEEAGKMEPGIHLGDARTKVWREFG